MRTEPVVHCRSNAACGEGPLWDASADMRNLASSGMKITRAICSVLHSERLCYKIISSAEDIFFNKDGLALAANRLETEEELERGAALPC